MDRALSNSYRPLRFRPWFETQLGAVLVCSRGTDIAVGEHNRRLSHRLPRPVDQSVESWALREVDEHFLLFLLDCS